MAADYGLDTGGNVVIQKPDAVVSGPATRISGGGEQFNTFGSAPSSSRADFSGVADSSANTLAALNKLTDGLLAPQIALAQKQQYFDGMSQVAQGKSLIQVEKDQPWYTKLFGPSATVQGAPRGLTMKRHWLPSAQSFTNRSAGATVALSWGSN